MKWVAVSGSWRKTSEIVEADVRREVRQIFADGNGLISGGALNVDYFALDEALNVNPSADRIKIFLPVKLNIFAKHYRQRALEGVIIDDQGEKLISQLQTLKSINTDALIENKKRLVLDHEAYLERNAEEIKHANELIAFWVNTSGGVADTIDKARKKGIPTRIFEYYID